MDVIYRRGQATAAEVLEGMPEPPGYSAVRAMLRVLEEKGHLRHDQQGPSYVFVPTVPREKARRRRSSNWCGRFRRLDRADRGRVARHGGASCRTGARPALPADQAGAEGGTLTMERTILNLVFRPPEGPSYSTSSGKSTLVLAAAGGVAMALRRLGGGPAPRLVPRPCAALVLPGLSLALPGWSWPVLPADGNSAVPQRHRQSQPPARRPRGSVTATSLEGIAFEDDESLAPARRVAPRPAEALTDRASSIMGHLHPLVVAVGGVARRGNRLLSAPIAGRIALRGWRRAGPIATTTGPPCATCRPAWPDPPRRPCSAVHARPCP